VLRRALIVLHEFQALLRVEGAEELRSRIPHQREVASHIFAGSETSLLSEVFGDRTRPFSGQAEPFRLGRLDPVALGTAIKAKLAETDRDADRVADWVYEMTAGHP
jgi:hypothetical protein